MLERIFSSDNIHTQGAYEIDRQVRARQRQMSIQPLEGESEAPLKISLVDKPDNSLMSGLFTGIWLLLGA